MTCTEHVRANNGSGWAGMTPTVRVVAAAATEGPPAGGCSGELADEPVRDRAPRLAGECTERVRSRVGGQDARTALRLAQAEPGPDRRRMETQRPWRQEALSVSPGRPLYRHSDERAMACQWHNGSMARGWWWAAVRGCDGAVTQQGVVPSLGVTVGIKPG
jgi:hypothetical protein